MKILLVDDDESAAEPIARYLTIRGHAVTSLTSATAAMAHFRSGEIPDLVIADIQMPGMDGIDLLKAIREEHADMPVILITGHATADTAICALRNRACDYLVKPIDMEMMAELIRRLEAGETTG